MKTWSLVLVHLFFITTIFSQGNLPVRFPEQNEKISSNANSQPLLLNDGRLFLIYSSNTYPIDTAYGSYSNDGGLTWNNKTILFTDERTYTDESFIFSGIVTQTNRIVLIIFTNYSYSGSSKVLKFSYSDDNGNTWTVPKNVIGNLSLYYPSLSQLVDGTIYICGHSNTLFFSEDFGESWSYRKNGGFHMKNMISIDSATVLGFYQTGLEENYDIGLARSTDGGLTWVASGLVVNDNVSEENPKVIKMSDGELYLFYQAKIPTKYEGIFQYDIYYKRSNDNGITWAEKTKLTNFVGNDFNFNLAKLDDKIFISFISNRWLGINQIWTGIVSELNDTNTPPTLYSFYNTPTNESSILKINATVAGEYNIADVILKWKIDNTNQQDVQMYDDGFHDDSLANDGIWGISMGELQTNGKITYAFLITDVNLNSVVSPGNTFTYIKEPESIWLTGGSFSNWYSNFGGEIEGDSGQFGWRWPAILPKQDMQVSKGLWIGTKNFIDENEIAYPYKVIHIGPRIEPDGFSTQILKKYNRFNKTQVKVNGKIQSSCSDDTTGSIESTLKADNMIINVVNTHLGITMTRKIMQFGQQYNDNYHVIEYTFKNTGNINSDAVIEFPSKTLEDVYFYFMYRLAICANTRYEIGNSTGWGTNTMIDTRGDGVKNDADNLDGIRAQFAWHGPSPIFTVYDNLGGPIWTLCTNVSSEDTIGRLGAAQFAGVATLHADKSATDHTDDSFQPSTTDYIASDESYANINASEYDKIRMEGEYNWMTNGHKAPRHCDKADPDGDFTTTYGVNPSLGGPEGYSFCNGYGPYTLNPGDSVVIVLAEGANGLSQEKSIEWGKEYKSEYTAAGNDVNAKKEADLKKNTRVMTGKDSLLMTFRRAISNYKSGFNIPQPPLPPKTFDVISNSNRINLFWSYNDDPKLKGIQIYRTENNYYNLYEKIFETNNLSILDYEDVKVIPGKHYFYYIVTYGDWVEGDSSLGISSGRLISNRYSTQTYDAVSITTTGVEASSIVKEYKLYQNYPNPFNPSTNISYSIPASLNPSQGGTFVMLKLYDILGKEVAILVNEEKTAGNYSIEFNSSKYKLSSGIYFYRLQAGEFCQTKKFVLMK